MVVVDYLVVGAGLTGATIARTLADAGCEVLVLERRDHPGGNVHDHLHASGIRVHTYGPHYFRTNSDEVWAFVNRFGEFFPYAAALKSLVEGRLECWPIQAEYIRRAVGEGWEAGLEGGEAANFEDASLAMMPRLVYERFVKGYTEKQWGVPARSLAAELAARFEVRADGDERLSRHRYQGIPREGYAAWVRRLLQGIPVELGCDYLAERGEFHARRLLVFTGAVDEYYGFDLGKLAYRAQRRETEYLPGEASVQPCGQVNHPAPEQGEYIRTLEWKHMMPPEEAAAVAGTLITREFPYTPEDSREYEYPFPDERNRRLYEAYRQRVEATPGLLVCGRLGEYRYLDMDQAIGAALRLGRKILQAHSVARSRLG